MILNPTAWLSKSALNIWIANRHCAIWALAGAGTGLLPAIQETICGKKLFGTKTQFA